MPHELDVVVPAVYGVGFAALLTGGGLLLAVRARVGSIFLLVGALSTFAASLIHVVADARSRRAPARAAGGALGDDGDAVETALDHPAAALQALSTGVISAGLACAVAVAFDAPARSAADVSSRVLLVVGAAAGVFATLLLAAAEAHRAFDVEEVLADWLARGGGADALAAAVSALEARHGAAARAPTCRPGCARPGASRAAAARALSPGVAAAAAANVAAAATLLAAAVVLLARADAAALVLFEIAFALFAAGLGCVLSVGALKMGEHRRGGRAHFIHDVRSALGRARAGAYRTGPPTA